jgi:hypothetical protein
VGDTANAWAVCDASSAGHLLWYNTMLPVVIAANGTAPSIPAASLTFTET